MARLYANENFPLDCVLELRGLGHDVLTVQDSGRGGCEDDEVLTYATTESRAVVTFNRRHFIKLHTMRSEHAGIIVCSFDADFVALAARTHAAIETVPTLAGTLLRVNRE